MALLQVDDLRVRYGASSTETLKGVSFDLAPDDFCAVIGPSGAGKSTLIRCINRLVEPSAGRITVFDQNVLGLRAPDLRRLRCRIGMIFQEFNLVNRSSVLDNVLNGALGRTGSLRSLFKLFPRQEIDRALDLLDRVGLSEHVGKRADELSGGQRQRVGIARALMQKPDLLLLDEPTSALDPKISRDVMGLIRSLANELRIPALCNIHDVRLALDYCNRVIGLQGGVKKIDSPTRDVGESDLDTVYGMAAH